MAVGVRVDARHEGGRHRPPQPPRQIRGHVLGEQQLQGQFAHQPAPPQLLHQAVQRVRVEHEVHRAIRPEHQQLRGLPPLRQVGQQVHRGPVTPLQVFEHEHQRGVGRQHVERLGEFAAHAGRGRPGHLALEPFQLRLAHQPRELYQPQGRIPPQHRQDRVARRSVAQLPQRLEERQVRFPLAIVLGALPPPDPPRAPGRTVGQKLIDHRRLANPDVAADEDELARAVGGALEPVLQPRDVLLRAPRWDPPSVGAGPPARPPRESDTPAGPPSRDTAAPPPRRPRPPESPGHTPAGPCRVTCVPPQTCWRNSAFVTRRPACATR